MQDNTENQLRQWRKKLGDIIFEAETPMGKAFDVILLWLILLSILAVMLESVNSIKMSYGELLRGLEWFFTALFTLEYFIRIYIARKRWHYIISFFGLIDLLAVLPSYLSIFITGSQYLLVIRSLRLLRVFRVLKLARYLGEADVLMRALKSSRIKITVFLGVVMTLVLIIGSLMYLVEGEANGFDSIPRSIYWAIVTLTTVGYGDISPQTPLGQVFASLVMILGYGIIAVPTGIVTVELSNVNNKEKNFVKCINCHPNNHDDDALFCKYCAASFKVVLEDVYKK